MHSYKPKGLVAQIKEQPRWPSRTAALLQQMNSMRPLVRRVPFDLQAIPRCDLELILRELRK